MTENPRDIFLRLVNGVAEARFDELPDLYGDVTDVRHPMATPEAAPLMSRKALEAHFGAPRDGSAPIPKRRPVDIIVHETVDPEVIVAEFSYEFTRRDGAVTKVPCVFVIRVRDGKIIESRDYIDPVRSMRARDALAGLIAVLQAEVASTGT